MLYEVITETPANGRRRSRRCAQRLPDRVFPLLEDAGAITLRGNYEDSIGRGLDDCQCGYTDPRDNWFAQISYSYTFRNTSRNNFV